MARTITEAQKTEQITAKDFSSFAYESTYPGINNTVFTIRDDKAYIGKSLINGVPYTNAITDLFIESSIGFPVNSKRVSGVYMFELDSSKSVMIVKLESTIYLYEHVSGGVPTAITSFSTSSNNREIYLEAIFCSTEKASTTGYVKFAFLNLPGEAWVVAYNTRIGTWQVEKVNNTYSTWASATNYAIGNRRIPTVVNGYYYEVSADAGSSGGTEPTWPTTIGDTVVDSGITWVCRGRYNNFPTTTSSSVKTLNGYIFVCVNGDIYNSDLDLPDSWNTSDFISTEIYPDDIVALAKYKNYLVAFGQNTIEFFYDAANASGSPLARQEGVLHNIGCVGQAMLTDTEDKIYWISQINSQSYSIWELDNFKAVKVSTPEIDVYLTILLSDPAQYNPSTVAQMFMFLFRLNGRVMIGIPDLDFGADGTGTGDSTSLFVLDLELKTAYSWEMNPYPSLTFSRPFVWKNYFLWASKRSGSGLLFSCLGINGYDANLSTTNVDSNFNSTPRLYSRRINFKTNTYKVINEIKINGFPSALPTTFAVSRDQGAYTGYTIPSGSFQVTRLGRAREFQIRINGELEFSDIAIKYIEHSN